MFSGLTWDDAAGYGASVVTVVVIAVAVVVAASAVLLGVMAWVRRARAWWRGRSNAREMSAAATRAWWRLVALTPPGRRHERNVRGRLGMPAGHPEHVTRPDSRVHAEALAALQEELWPEGEWVDVIRMHLEGP